MRFICKLELDALFSQVRDDWTEVLLKESGESLFYRRGLRMS